MPAVLANWEAEVGRISLPPAWANKLQDPISKTTRAKWTGDMAQVVEHLLFKRDALSSNSHPIKRKKKKREKLFGEEVFVWSAEKSFVLFAESMGINPAICKQRGRK
jgi:2,3-bisphosphoglycerate-independent phosphoglycerate mutase